MRPLEEDPLCFSDSILDGLPWVLWEVVIADNKLVKLVSEVVSTGCATMTVVNSEEGASRPLVDLLELRLNDVENDADSVFVVVPDDALMSVR